MVTGGSEYYSELVRDVGRVRREFFSERCNRLRRLAQYRHDDWLRSLRNPECLFCQADQCEVLCQRCAASPTCRFCEQAFEGSEWTPRPMSAQRIYPATLHREPARGESGELLYLPFGLIDSAALDQIIRIGMKCQDR